MCIADLTFPRSSKLSTCSIPSVISSINGLSYFFLGWHLAQPCNNRRHHQYHHQLNTGGHCSRFSDAHEHIAKPRPGAGAHLNDEGAPGRHHRHHNHCHQRHVHHRHLYSHHHLMLNFVMKVRLIITINFTTTLSVSTSPSMMSPIVLKRQTTDYPLPPYTMLGEFENDRNLDCSSRHVPLSRPTWPPLLPNQGEITRGQDIDIDIDKTTGER